MARRSSAPVRWSAGGRRGVPSLGALTFAVYAFLYAPLVVLVVLRSFPAIDLQWFNANAHLVAVSLIAACDLDRRTSERSVVGGGDNAAANHDRRWMSTRG